MLPSFVTHAHCTAFKQLTYISGLDPPVCFVMHSVGRGGMYVCMCVIVYVHVFDSRVCPCRPTE